MKLKIEVLVKITPRNFIAGTVEAFEICSIIEILFGNFSEGLLLLSKVLKSFSLTNLEFEKRMNLVFSG
jgi:hypothetical protein